MSLKVGKDTKQKQPIDENFHLYESYNVLEQRIMLYHLIIHLQYFFNSSEKIPVN